MLITLAQYRSYICNTWCGVVWCGGGIDNLNR